MYTVEEAKKLLAERKIELPRHGERVLLGSKTVKEYIIGGQKYPLIWNYYLCNSFGVFSVDPL